MDGGAITRRTPICEFERLTNNNILSRLTSNTDSILPCFHVIINHMIPRAGDHHLAGAHATTIGQVSRTIEAEAAKTKHTGPLGQSSGLVALKFNNRQSKRNRQGHPVPSKAQDLESQCSLPVLGAPPTRNLTFDNIGRLHLYKITHHSNQPWSRQRPLDARGPPVGEGPLLESLKSWALPRIQSRQRPLGARCLPVGEGPPLESPKSWAVPCIQSVQLQGGLKRKADKISTHQGTISTTSLYTTAIVQPGVCVPDLETPT